jgi:glutamine synthetase
MAWARTALESAFEGDAYRAQDRACPIPCRSVARELVAASAGAREAFGEEVISHYRNAADIELAAFDSAVTDWERVRGFERL